MKWSNWETRGRIRLQEEHGLCISSMKKRGWYKSRYDNGSLRHFSCDLICLRRNREQDHQLRGHDVGDLRIEKAWTNYLGGRVNRKGSQNDCWARDLLRLGIMEYTKKGDHGFCVFLHLHSFIQVQGWEVGLNDHWDLARWVEWKEKGVIIIINYVI